MHSCTLNIHIIFPDSQKNSPLILRLPPGLW